MKYVIKNRINKIDNSVLAIDIDFEPENHPLGACISQMRLWRLPNYITSQSLSESYGEEHVRIMNYVEMDWEDKVWAKNVKGSEIEAGEMFLVHDVMGKSIINERIFDNILFDYGSKALEVYQSDTSFPDTWKDEMTVALERLKSKINNESPS